MSILAILVGYHLNVSFNSGLMDSVFTRKTHPRVVDKNEKIAWLATEKIKLKKRVPKIYGRRLSHKIVF